MVKQASCLAVGGDPSKQKPRQQPGRDECESYHLEATVAEKPNCEQPEQRDCREEMDR